MSSVVRQRYPASCSLLLLFLLLFVQAATAATPETFKTAEYWNSTGLEIINAATAYSKGYTGNGISLGLIDDPVLWSHPELQDKFLGRIYPDGYPIDDLSLYLHGSHVAGIMVAAANGVGMEGVAFNARLYGVVIDLRDVPQQLSPPDFYTALAARPELKILNNSWGCALFPYEGNDTVASVSQWLSTDISTIALKKLSEQNDKLVVFAGGNSGRRSPEVGSVLPRYYPELTGWINVVSLDPAGITIDAAGHKTGDVRSVSIFSNLAGGAQDFTVAAPGSDINSLDATGSGTGYRLLSGTSMAAPYVSGALGLVQEAFPWMTNKQLADCVLTTADNPANGRFTPPASTITIEKTETNDGSTQLRVLFHAIDTPVPTDVQSALRAYYDKNAQALASYYHILSFGEFQSAYAGTFSYTNPAGRLVLTSAPGETAAVTFADVFGQGILNVGLAVGGPALLDANRLSRADVSAAYGCALYRVDTQGDTGVWSNDIGQRSWNNAWHLRDFQYLAGDDPTDPNKADALALIGRNVGLWKDGQGTLVLTGSSTYAGATVVSQGTLAVETQPGVAGSGTLVASSVFVERDGTLTGNGTVRNAVTNAGTFIPGDGPGTGFTVGSYRQEGDASNLILLVSAANGTTSLIGNQLLFAGGTVTLGTLQTYYATQSWTFPFTSLLDGAVTTANGFDWNRNVVVGWYAAGSDTVDAWTSPTLQPRVAVTQNAAGTPTDLTLLFWRAPNAYSRYASDANAAAVGAVLDQTAGAAQGDAQNLVAALDYSFPAGNQVSDALRQLGPRQFAATARAALASQRDLNRVLLPRLTSSGPEAAAAPTGIAGGDAAGPVRRAFVVPLGRLSRAGAADGLTAASVDAAGSLAGLETDIASAGGTGTLGGHLAYLHRNQRSGGPGDNRSWTDGVHLGGHFRFAPRALATPTTTVSLFALTRLGLENTTQRRSVAINGYLRTAQADWLAPVGSLLAGGALDLSPQALDGRCSFGPVAWLDWDAVWRPALREHGGQAINLKLREGWGTALHSNLGLRLTAILPVLPGVGRLKAEASGLWNHELLGEAGSIKARFASFGGTFTTHAPVPDRDGLNLAGGLTANCTDRLTLGLTAGAELGRRHYDTWGGLNLGWTF